ncbi:MAG: phosphoribosylformylglycinamidine synthase subunit PurQ [Alphaproteobacteria bacterium]
MRSAVIVFPGSNCDRDMAVALHTITGTPPLMVWHQETDLPAADLVALPGGFSYGDYLRCGTMAAHAAIMPEIRRHIQQGRKVLGVCNGFQMLTEAHLLPGALRRNHGLKFIHRMVTIKDAQHGEALSMPIAHHDGCYLLDSSDLARLQDQGGIAYRYTHNPNGSVDDIAGVFNETKTVLGLMPHPERAVDPDLGLGTDGRRVIESFLG